MMETTSSASGAACTARRVLTKPQYVPTPPGKA
jgi:hypothetical protein